MAREALCDTGKVIKQHRLLAAQCRPHAIDRVALRLLAAQPQELALTEVPQLRLTAGQLRFNQITGASNLVKATV